MQKAFGCIGEKVLDQSCWLPRLILLLYTIYIPSLVSAREVHLRNAWKLHRHVSTMQRPSSMSSSKRQLR